MKSYVIQVRNSWKSPIWYLSPPFYFLINAKTVLVKKKKDASVQCITLKITSPDVQIPMSVVPSKHWVALVIRDLLQ